ncbi:STE3-domain-containing protein [Peniophora sp. CONT]|nr:STE3-domain-containing protein [Peniophora sp. CONT]
MLFLVMLTSFIRHNWNLGVIFLCFWLFIDCLTYGINFIIWSDNADVKLLVYCDIVSHVQVIAFTVKSMATLIITRRLYIIADLQSVNLPNQRAKRWNTLLEWTLGLVVPMLVAGPIYYINQDARFQVEEAFGCGNSSTASITFILLIQSWNIIPPLLSILLYYPRVARIFYKQSKDVNRFLHSNGSVTRTNYLRILALASVDILFTLPVGIVSTVLIVTTGLAQDGGVPLYPGWTSLHSDWAPASYSYADLKSAGTFPFAQVYFAYCTSPALAFVFFALFGLTTEARASYWHIICTIGGWCGWKPLSRAHNGRSSLGMIEFGTRPQEMSSLDIETNLVDFNLPRVKKDDSEGDAESEPGRSQEEITVLASGGEEQ